MKSEIEDHEKEDRPYQFNVKALLLIAVVVALPLGIWKFRQTRNRQYAEAAEPFEKLGGVVASNPESFTQFLKLYIFHKGDHRITSISFMEEPMTDRQLRSIHDDLHSLPNLNRILLEDTKITDKGLLTIADLDQLSWIRLDGTTVSDEGVAMLQDMELMQELGLARIKVTDEGLKHLGQMTQSRTLMLSDTQITDSGLAHLENKPKLRMLTLRNTAITDAGLSCIAELTNLETLDLGNTQISDVGLMQLVDLNNLKNVAVEGTAVTQAGVRQTRAALPLCRVSCDFD